MRYALLTVLLLLAGVRALSAQQPFITDDSDVTSKGKVHLEFSNEIDWLQRSSLPARRQNTASFELNYGLLEGLEVAVEMPLLAIFNARPASPLRPVGMGDTMVSMKYNFRREPENTRGLAMAVAANVEVPTGDTSRGLGSGLADVAVNGILQSSITPRTRLRMNGGFQLAGNLLTGAVGLGTRGFVMSGGASLVRAFTPRLQLGAELTGALTRNFDLGKGLLQVLGGGNYTLREGLTLDFAVLGGRFSAAPRIGGQLGFSLDF